MSAAGCMTPVCAGSENRACVVKGTTQTTQAEPPEDESGPFERVIGSTQPSTHHTAPKPTTTRTSIPTTRRIRATLARVSAMVSRIGGGGLVSCRPADVSGRTGTVDNSRYRQRATRQTPSSQQG